MTTLNKMGYIIILIDIALFIIFFILGWLSNLAYHEIVYQRDISGLHMYDNITEFEAKDVAQTYDTKGTWICVNIRGMSIQEMIDTCSHESAHEIFAQKCTNNATKCLEQVSK